MSSEPSSTQTRSQAEYRAWLGELKCRFRQVQLKAAVAVNTALLQFYWELGADIVARQAQADWDSGFLNQLSADLMGEFPEVKGFSASNLKYIRQWYAFYAVSPVIGQQPVAQLVKRPVAQLLSIPWGHNLAILAKPVGRVRDVIGPHPQIIPKKHGRVDKRSASTFCGRDGGCAPLIHPTESMACWAILESPSGVTRQFAAAVAESGVGLRCANPPTGLPENLRDKLPSIESIERELGLDDLGAGV